MFDSLSRSWALTKLSWKVLVADKEMLLFPLLGGIFSLLFTAAVLWPTVIVHGVEIAEQLEADNAEAITWSALQYAGLFVTYFGLAFIATFFSVCTVYTTKTRLEGGDATFMESIRYAFSHLPAIAAWSFISASFGMLMRGLERAAERIPLVGGILLSILVGVLGLAWSVTTIFVVPAMVYRNEGPIDAFKASVDAITKTWGESLARHFGLGWIQGLVTLLGICMFVPAILFTVNTPAIALSMLGLFIVYIIGVALTFSVMNSVFNTALFVYAQTGSCPGGWDGDLLQSAFVQK